MSLLYSMYSDITVFRKHIANPALFFRPFKSNTEFTVMSIVRVRKKTIKMTRKKNEKT